MQRVVVLFVALAVFGAAGQAAAQSARITPADLASLVPHASCDAPRGHETGDSVYRRWHRVQLRNPARVELTTPVRRGSVRASERL